MTIKKRKEVWWFDLTINGVRKKGSCKTTIEKQAQEYHDQLQAGMWKAEVNGEKVRRTWAETVERWLDERQEKRSHKDDLRIAMWWNDKFAQQQIVYLDQITPDVVQPLRDAELGREYVRTLDKKVTRVGEASVVRKIQKATVNRKLAFLRTIINAAHRRYLWLLSRPLFEGYAEKTRMRYLEPHEFARLVTALPDPYGEMATFSVVTGLRRSNVLGLRWEHVNMVRRAATFPEKLMKNGLPLTIPLNATAMGVIRQRIGKHDTLVFPNTAGNAYQEVASKMWKEALDKAGITNFKWHDLRHTWASWLRQRGEGLDMIQELGGWQTRDMVQRYAHLNVEHLFKSAGVLDDIFAPAKVGQSHFGTMG